MLGRVFALMCVLVVGQAARAQDRIYEAKGEHGRPLFTNAGDVAVGGAAPDALTLPPLATVDFAAAPPATLASVDARVERAHRALHSGPRCQALRDGAARTFADTLWGEHAPDVAWVLGLVGLSWALRRALRGHALGLAFSALPLFAGVAFGALSVQTVREVRAALSEGAAACTEPLVAGDASPGTVQQRYQQVLDMQERVASAYARQEQRVAAIFAEARR